MRSRGRTRSSTSGTTRSTSTTSSASRGSTGRSVSRLVPCAAAVNNWRTWGPDDELGTLNYITPQKIVSACRLVSAGRVIQLGVPLDRKEGPQATAPRRYNPIHFMDELPVDYVLPGGVGVADD